MICMERLFNVIFTGFIEKSKYKNDVKYRAVSQNWEYKGSIEEFL